MKKDERYNKGVESGLKVAQKIIDKEADALEHLKKQVDKVYDKQSGMREAVEAVITCQNDEAINKYYRLRNQKSPKDLSAHEKGVLMNIIATLAVSGAAKNHEQEKFLNNLRRFIGVSDYELDHSYSYENLDNIKNIDSQIIMARAIREYLFLADNSVDIYEKYKELFGTFRLNDKDYMLIDGAISITFFIFGVAGIVETYGNYCDEKVGIDETLPYLNINHAEKLQISKECASIYFNNCMRRKENTYVESSSYVIYEEANQLVAYHKQSSEKKILAGGIDIKEIFKFNNITTYQDMVFYVVGNDVYFYSLIDDVNGLFMSLARKYENDELLPVRNIGLSESKFIYGNDKLYVVDLETKESKNIKVEGYGILGAYRKYVIIGDYLYFVISVQQKKGSRYYDAYKFIRYGLKNMQVTDLSGQFIKEWYFWDTIDIKKMGCYENNVILLLKKANVERGSVNDSSGEFYCVVMDTADEHAKPKVIEIEGNHKVVGEKYINQLTLCDNHVIFIDHKYDVYSLDIFSGNKEVVKRKCGKDNKDYRISLSAKLSLGVLDTIKYYDKYETKDPAKLLFMGNWLYCEKGEGAKICSINRSK